MKKATKSPRGLRGARRFLPSSQQGEHDTPYGGFKGKNTRSSSREVRIRVPTFFRTSILVGEPSEPKIVDEKGHYWGT